jgi:hypothetical protein
MAFVAIPNRPVPELVDGRNRKIGGQLKQWLTNQHSSLVNAVRALTLRHNIATPAYGPTVKLDLSQGGIHQVVATDGNAFTISAPMNPTQLATWDLSIFNNTGGALGTVTFDPSIKQSGFTDPGAGKRTTASFYLQGGVSYQRTPWSTGV